MFRRSHLLFLKEKKAKELCAKLRFASAPVRKIFNGSDVFRRSHFFTHMFTRWKGGLFSWKMGKLIERILLKECALYKNPRRSAQFALLFPLLFAAFLEESEENESF